MKVLSLKSFKTFSFLHELFQMHCNLKKRNLFYISIHEHINFPPYANFIDTEKYERKTYFVKHEINEIQDKCGKFLA